MCNSSTEGAHSVDGVFNTLSTSSRGILIPDGSDSAVHKHQVAWTTPVKKCASRQEDSHQLFFNKVISGSGSHVKEACISNPFFFPSLLIPSVGISLLSSSKLSYIEVRHYLKTKSHVVPTIFGRANTVGPPIAVCTIDVQAITNPNCMRQVSISVFCCDWIPC